MCQASMRLHIAFHTDLYLLSSCCEDCTILHVGAGYGVQRVQLHDLECPVNGFSAGKRHVLINRDK